MRRLLSGVGRTLITAGVLLLLFVAYQLWGTGIRQAQAQTKSLSAFEQQLAELGASPISLDENPELGTTDTLPSNPSDSTVPSTEPTPATAGPTVPADTAAVSTVPGTGSTTTPPAATAAPGPSTTALPQVRAGRSKMQAPKPGKTMGLLVIPRIKVRQTVVEGTAKEDLQTGPGHYSGTPFPGQPGNVGIAGHRTTYGAPFFNLNLLKPGDPIFIQTLQGNFRYDVIDACQPKCTGSGWFVVTPNDRRVLAPTPDENLLTLTTCHPQYTAKERLIVRARLVGPAADADFFAPVSTVPPTTIAPTPSTALASDGVSFDSAAVTEVAGDTDPSTVTAPVGATTTTIAGPAAALAEPPSLSGERDPHGSGPVWKVGLFQGHRSTWLETGLLAALCAAIWLGFWLLARPRRLAAQAVIYTLGFVFVFLPALYFCFEHLARLLPENL